jgi:5-hydroxyisourate hydrolase
MSAITTHVLDTAQGRPAVGVLVRLEQVVGADGAVLAAGTTDEDGRVTDLGPDRVCPGTYRLVLNTAGYFARTGQPCFFPEVSLSFVVADPEQHHHVPVLLSPFAYSTYRGS